MKLHEYQAKEIISQYGAKTPNGFMLDDLKSLPDILKKIPSSIKVVKAQIHAGGRGKGGGVKVCKSDAEATTAANSIFGKMLVTAQTGKEGQKVRKLLIEEGLNIKRELYFSILIDRQTKKIIIMASTEGGVEIEEVAKNTPDKIVKEFISPTIGLRSYQVQKICSKLQLDTNKELYSNASKLFNQLYQAFINEDAAMLEINPLIVTDKNEVVALDCKMLLDDNGLGRHPNSIALRDLYEEDPMETEASKHDLNYIKLDGEIGCMVNGAGLAMATMDIIKLHGGNPANFLDVGGGATQERVEEALKLICHDKSVKCVFINIFGGIVRCDMIASGIIGALENLNLNIPIVVRLQGNNAEIAHKLIKESKFSNMLEMIDDLTQAAKAAVNKVK